VSEYFDMTTPEWILFFAVPEEVRFLLKQLKHRGIPCIRKRPSNLLPGESLWQAGRVLFHVTGMGPYRANQITLPPLSPAGISPQILTCGFAGALNPKMSHGQVLFDADSGFLPGLYSKPHNLYPGRFHQADRVAVTRQQKAELWASTEADAVEMESGILRQRCRDRGLRSATVRVISDVANEDLPMDFNAVMSTDGRMLWDRFALQLLASPRRVPALIRFQSRVQSAAEQLAEALLSLDDWVQSAQNSRRECEVTDRSPKCRR
jgi:hypothetical protein